MERPRLCLLFPFKYLLIFVLRNIGWALASLSVGGIIAGGIGRGLTFYLSRHFQGNYSFGSSVSIYFGYEVDVVFCSALRVVDQPYYAFLTGLIGFFSPFGRGASAAGNDVFEPNNMRLCQKDKRLLT